VNGSVNVGPYPQFPSRTEGYSRFCTLLTLPPRAPCAAPSNLTDTSSPVRVFNTPLRAKRWASSIMALPPCPTWCASTSCASVNVHRARWPRGVKQSYVLSEQPLYCRSPETECAFASAENECTHELHAPRRAWPRCSLAGLRPTVLHT